MSFRCTNPNFSRRQLLSALGAGVALSPMLPLMDASGQDLTGINRLVLIFTPHGTHYPFWLPSGSGSNFTLNSVMAPLEAFKDRLVVLGNVDIVEAPGQDGAHDRGCVNLWTGSRYEEGGGGLNQSIDQFVADKIAGDTAFRSLELGMRCGGSSGRSRTIWSGPGQPLHPEEDPQAAFDRVFGAGIPQPTMEKVHNSRGSLLDLVGSELQRIQTKAHPEDRLKIEAHLEAVRGLERRLNGPAAGVGCALPAVSGASPDGQFDGFVDIIAAGMSCDMLRVASIQVARGQTDSEDGFYNFLGLDDDRSHHLMTHSKDDDSESWGKVETIHAWFHSKLARLMTALDAVPEGGGTMLDSTLIAWGSELGHGNRHSQDQVPFLLAGGAPGLPTGKFLNFEGNHLSHNHLLVSIAQLMGYPEIQSFGDLDPDCGPVPGLV